MVVVSLQFPAESHPVIETALWFHTPSLALGNPSRGGRRPFTWCFGGLWPGVPADNHFGRTRPALSESFLGETVCVCGMVVVVGEHLHRTWEGDVLSEELVRVIEFVAVNILPKNEIWLFNKFSWTSSLQCGQYKRLRVCLCYSVLLRKHANNWEWWVPMRNMDGMLWLPLSREMREGVLHSSNSGFWGGVSWAFSELLPEIDEGGISFHKMAAATFSWPHTC